MKEKCKRCNKEGLYEFDARIYCWFHYLEIKNEFLYRVERRLK